MTRGRGGSGAEVSVNLKFDHDWPTGFRDIQV